MEKIVKLLHRKSCVVLTALCVLTFSTCRFPYTVKNARFKNEFSWVYAEKDFNFKNAGKVQGTFTLPKNVKHKGLRFVAMFPATFRNNKWSAVIKMPYKLTLTWEGGSLLKEEDVEAKSDWFGLNVYFSEEEIRKLPVQQTIIYTLEYKAGVYTKLQDTAELDKLADLQDHPESYPNFYDAVFVVAERSTKKMP